MFDRLKKHTKGFTLIELLVVIAIIGILAGIVLVSFTGIRGGARDAQRVSDIKQLAFILETVEATNPNTALTGCATAGMMNDTTTCSNTGDIATNFLKLKDPSTATIICGAATGAGLVGAAVDAVCKYGISAAVREGQAASVPKTSDYQICFYLEEGSGSLTKGENAIQTGAGFKTSGVTACS